MINKQHKSKEYAVGVQRLIALFTLVALQVLLNLFVVNHCCVAENDVDTIKIEYDSDLSQEEANELVERLFIQASSGEIKYRDVVQPSKDSIIALGAKALPVMCSKLTSRDARERWTISDIFRGLGKVATDSLISYLDSNNKWVLLNVGRCLEQIKDTSATLPCLPLLSHDYYPVRSQFAQAIGRAADPRATEDLIYLLKRDEVGDVRKSAAVALGRIADSQAIIPLVRALADPYFGVRKTASRALTQYDPVPMQAVVSYCDSLSGIYLGTALETLGSSENPKIVPFLAEYLSHDQSLIRGYAIMALAHVGHADAGKALIQYQSSRPEMTLFEKSALREARGRLAATDSQP